MTQKRESRENKMKTYHVNRLKKLAEYLYELPPQEYFNMTDWFKGGCNTASCALGHACTIKSFKKAGLRAIAPLISCGNYYPIYKNLRGFSAAKEFFGIEYSESLHLFSKDSYNKVNSPQEVANAIIGFLYQKNIIK